MDSLHTFVTSPQFRRDMSVFRKYICECPCIYDLFGLSRNKTPYVHFTNENQFEYDDLYKPVVYGTEPSAPEVIYHHHHHPTSNESSPDIIIDVPDNNIAEQTHYADELTLPPLALVHVDLSDTDSDGSVVSQQSHDSSIDIIVAERDLPEKDEWDIL